MVLLNDYHLFGRERDEYVVECDRRQGARLARYRDVAQALAKEWDSSLVEEFRTLQTCFDLHLDSAPSSAPGLCYPISYQAKRQLAAEAKAQLATADVRSSVERISGATLIQHGDGHCRRVLAGAHSMTSP